MLTGDDATTAKAVANELEIDEVIAGVRPAQKAAQIKRLQNQGSVVAMAGDGINDAPALAQAMSDSLWAPAPTIAIESATVTLVGGDLQALVRAAVFLKRRCTTFAKT